MINLVDLYQLNQKLRTFQAPFELFSTLHKINSTNSFNYSREKLLYGKILQFYLKSFCCTVIKRKFSPINWIFSLSFFPIPIFPLCSMLSIVIIKSLFAYYYYCFIISTSLPFKFSSSCRRKTHYHYLFPFYPQSCKWHRTRQAQKHFGLLLFSIFHALVFIKSSKNSI